MIVGIGTDLVEVKRVEKLLKDKERFRDHMFTDGEITACDGNFRAAEKYAARFAAKEAAVKALGTGLRGGIEWRDIELLNDELGKPSLHFHGKAKKLADSLGVTGSFVSISHLKDYATAVVVLEGER